VKKSRKKILPYALIVPSTIFILLVVAFPIVYTFVLSFTKWDMMKSSELVFVGLGNYIKLFAKDLDFYNSLKITSIYVVSTVLLEFLIGFGLALLLHNIRLKIMRVVSSILLMPIVFVPVAVGTVWRLIFNNDAGFINEILRFLFPNINAPMWLIDPKLALISVIIVDVWQATPFFMILILGGLKSMPEEPFEAAIVDGASTLQSFRYLTLHYLTPVILIALIFRVVETFREFDKVFMLTGSGPGGTTELISLYAYHQSFRLYNLGYASAIAIIMLIIMGLATWSLIRALKIEI